MDNEDDVYMDIIVKKNKKKSKECPTHSDFFKEYAEIPFKHLKYFFGQWIKYINTDSYEYFSGGSLVECNTEYRSVYLRQLKPGLDSNIIKITHTHHIKYFVKNTSEFYRAYKNLQDDIKRMNYYKKNEKNGVPNHNNTLTQE